MRHTIYRRAIAILVVLLVFAQMGQVALSYHRKQQEAAAAGQETERKKLTLWYTDEKLNAYLVEAAAAFEEEYGAEVTLQLVTAVDYIEHINTASISDLGGPDLFITSSELLGKARLAGLTVENDSFTAGELKKDFPQKAIDAATCGGKLMAYPFYFETCFLLYNTNYVDSAPDTIDEILDYADNYEATEETQNVENIFKWNVADIFSNFFFISNYVNLGGETGDDPAQVQLDAQEVKDCLAYYQSLNAFFAIDADEVTTDSVLQEFIDGKTVYTIAKTDAIAKLDAAVAEQGGEGFYGIAEVPDLTGDLATKGLSVTNSVVVNAYSKERELSKEFARYLTCERVQDLYPMSDKMPVCLNVDYENSQMPVLLDQYENSVEVPKLTDLSNYWIEMEIAFANIWKGNDVNTEVDAVTQKVMQHLQTQE